MFRTCHMVVRVCISQIVELSPDITPTVISESRVPEGILPLIPSINLTLVVVTFSYLETLFMQNSPRIHKFGLILADPNMRFTI